MGQFIEAIMQQYTLNKDLSTIILSFVNYTCSQNKCISKCCIKKNIFNDKYICDQCYEEMVSICNLVKI